MLSGQQIDQYLIQNLLARGGMAEVYLAQDITLQRKIALKILLPELTSDKTAVARFHREARAVAQLNHPHIIQIYTIGTLPGGRPYLAMPYIDGGTLQEHLTQIGQQEQRLPLLQALTLARQIASALQAAHLAGIIHRDLKPGNILLQAEDNAILTDLGIAAVQSATLHLTQTGQFIGTPHYMAPEQAQGKTVDGRTDIYALGIILYEMLAGHPPFTGDSPLSLLHQQLYEPPPPLPLAAPDLALSTYHTVDICLQKKPEDRFQTATDLVLALDQALQDEGSPAPINLAPLPSARRPFPFRWLTTGLALAILVITGFIYWPRSQAPEPTSSSISTRIVVIPTSTPIATQTVPGIVLSPIPTETPTTTPLTIDNSQLTIDNSPTPTVTPSTTPTPLPPTRPPVITSEVTATYLATPPQLDGDPADWPPTTPIQSTFLIHQDPAWDGTEDLIVAWQVGWDQTNLYLIAIVTDNIHVQTQTDNQIFKGDSLDIQVDANRADGLAHWAPDVFQITFSPGNFQALPPSAFRWQGNDDNRAVAVPAGNIQLQAQPTTIGYTLEAAVPWSDLNITPTPGLQIGLALNATDNDTPDTAVQEIFLSNIPNRRLLDPTTWGTLTLQETGQ